MTEIDYAALDYSRWPFHQSLWQKGIALVVRLLARVRMEGFEKIPPTGCFLAATNHMHILDVPLYFSMAPRRTICFVSDNWQNTPLLGLFLKKVGQVIFVTLRKRKNGDHKSNRTALAQGLSVLRSGGVLALAPEGGLGVGGLKKGLPGIAYLANRAPAPMLPMLIYGQENVWQHWKRLRRAPVYFRFGPLIQLPARRMKSDELQDHTDRIMVELARLLPPEYRGTYQDVGQTESSGQEK